MDLITALTIGLVGSLHCLGMCGPLALALPVGQQRSAIKRVLSRSLYHLGRAATYSLFGLLAGGLGTAFNFIGIQARLSIVLGILLILSLVYPPKWITSVIYLRLYTPLKRALGKRLGSGKSADFFKVGMLNGLLPCGLVYAAMAGASLQGSWLLQGSSWVLRGPPACSWLLQGSSWVLGRPRDP